MTSTPNRDVNQNCPMSDERYRERQQRLKDKVDARVAAAGRARHCDGLYRQRQRQNHRRLWHRDPRRRPWQKVGVIQFIKGTRLTASVIRWSLTASNFR